MVTAASARVIFYYALVDYLYAAIIFVFIVTVLVVLWKREHPKNPASRP